MKWNRHVTVHFVLCVAKMLCPMCGMPYYNAGRCTVDACTLYTRQSALTLTRVALLQEIWLSVKKLWHAYINALRMLYARN